MALYCLESALKLASLPRLERDPLLVVVLGPTGSGKTALALALGRRFGGEIVNCDSVAMYREFEIGTTKPTLAERAEVPHHLFDCADPLAEVTAGEYARRARTVVREIAERGQLPIVSGGTGLYLRALLQGLFAGPLRSEELREQLRGHVQDRGVDHVHGILQRLDAAAAERIHPNDLPKVIRAIEVCLASSQPMTGLWAQGREPLHGFRILRLGLNPEREALYERINERAQKMFDEGLIAETEALLAKYGTSVKPLAALGYRQAVQFLRGEIDRETALRTTQQAHRNYAKRQMTWFRREPEVTWLEGFGSEATIQAKAMKKVEDILRSADFSKF